MGPRNWAPLLGAQVPSVGILVGSFLCDGANQPSVIIPTNHRKWQISAPVAGVYTVTMDDGALAIMGGFAMLADPAVNSARRAVLSTFLSGNGTFTITTQSTAGADANIAGAALCSVTFVIFIAGSVLAQ